MSEEKIKLTSLSQEGGCGSKMPPSVLQKILAGVPAGIVPQQLLAGAGSCDDAAVYQISPQQAIVASTDFCVPMVDDPHDFGRIAATNAVSDIYAMGGAPLFALSIVGMPVKVLPPETISLILQGGEAVCRAAGIPVVGGNFIDSPEPVYGLVVIGLANPAHLKRNIGARPGDKLILGKPLGVGVYGVALRRELLHASDYEAMLEIVTQMNTPGPMLACLDGVNAMTNVGGFGLAGHLVEICRGSGLRAALHYDSLPLLPRTRELVEAACLAGASERNWTSYGEQVNMPQTIEAAARTLLTDPQTSGGLLVSCAPESVTEVLSLFLQQGFSHVSVIGEISEGEPGIDIV